MNTLTLAAALTLASIASAQETLPGALHRQAQRVEPLVMPEHPVQPVEAAPILDSAGDLGFGEGVSISQAGAAAGLPSSGPMLDRSELAIPVFKRIASLAGFTIDRQDKRGLRVSHMDPTARRVMVAHSQTSAQATADPCPIVKPAAQLVQVVAQAAPGAVRHAARRSRGGGSRGATVYALAVAAGARVQGAYARTGEAGPLPGRMWEDGHTVKMGDRTYTMTGYDESKAYGSRHRWVGQGEDGSRQEFYTSPLVFDLDGDGVRMSRRTQKFDADGDRRADRVNDISRGDGLLVLDSDGDGVSGESALEAFGTATDLDGDHERDSYADGFEALQALVAKAESAGVLGPQEDARLDAEELRALEKAYGLRIKVGGILAKPVRLSAAGIVSIALSRAESTLVKDFDGQGNRVTRRDGARFTRADGSSSSYEDVWFEVVRPAGALVASR